MSRSICAVFALVCLSVLAGMPGPAAAQSDCTQWSVADGWYAVQGSYRV